MSIEWLDFYSTLILGFFNLALLFYISVFIKNWKNYEDFAEIEFKFIRDKEGLGAVEFTNLSTNIALSLNLYSWELCPSNRFPFVKKISVERHCVVPNSNIIIGSPSFHFVGSCTCDQKYYLEYKGKSGTKYRIVYTESHRDSLFRSSKIEKYRDSLATKKYFYDFLNKVVELFRRN